jgi:hypothetical protein
MPIHNVDEAFDPTFWDYITVVRRQETVSGQGRTVMKLVTSQQLAVVVPASPNDLNRLPEADMMNRAITIYTPYRLQSSSINHLTGSQTLPDQIVWHNTTFIVRILDDYSGYGRGWIQATAVSYDSIPAPPIPDPIGSA